MVTLRELGLNARDIQGGKNTRGDEKKTFFPRQMTAHTHADTGENTRGDTRNGDIPQKRENENMPGDFPGLTTLSSTVGALKKKKTLFFRVEKMAASGVAAGYNSIWCFRFLIQ